MAFVGRPLRVSNRNLQAAWRYHDGTKHSAASVRASRHFLDWGNQPLPFKIYTTLEPIPLPRPISPVDAPALCALTTPGDEPPGEVLPSLQDLAEILHLAAGIVRRRSGPGGETLFRAAACTGALYHIELYVACADLPGLPAGLYHFSPLDHALGRLRSGDQRAALAEASGGEPAVEVAPVVVALTSTYWRNAWKYQARAYRHAFWDGGTVLANLLAAAAARRIPARVVAGFADAAVGALLGTDPDREGPVALVPLGRTAARAPGPASRPEPLSLPTQPLSRKEIDYQAIREMNAASSLATPGEVARWRRAAPHLRSAPASGRTRALAPLPSAQAPTDTLARVVLRRGSTRRFSRSPITWTQLSTVLHHATRGIPADFLEPYGARLNDVYLIVNAVEGLPPGTYAMRRDADALEVLREGLFRKEAGDLALWQDLAADAAADIFFLAELAPILEHFGNRGYRAAQLEGGIRGGKVYLAAHALGLGATGLTFFDDDVTAFFSPHAEAKSVMFLAALGRPAARRGGAAARGDCRAD